jgi:hypothetical protein
LPWLSRQGISQASCTNSHNDSKYAHNVQHVLTVNTFRMACVLTFLQWPLHACTAIAQIAQQQPRSPSVPAAIRVLGSFFTQGGVYFLERTTHVAIPSLQASVRQQVEQSGMLQQLPALMIAAAVELSVQAKENSFIRYGQQAATGVALASALYGSSVRPLVHHLLRIFTNTCRLWTGNPVGR